MSCTSMGKIWQTNYNLQLLDKDYDNCYIFITLAFMATKATLTE